MAKFTWAKEAQTKLEKMKEEGKPMPKNMAEVLYIAFKIAALWHIFTLCFTPSILFYVTLSFLGCSKKIGELSIPGNY